MEGVLGVDGVLGVEGVLGVDGVLGGVVGGVGVSSGVSSSLLSWGGSSGSSASGMSDISLSTLSVGGMGRKFSSLSLQATNAGSSERDRIKAVKDFIFFINTSLKIVLLSPQERCNTCIQTETERKQNLSVGRYADLR